MSLVTTLCQNNTLYKYKKTQALVRLVNYFDEGEWLMVEDEEGNVFTAHKTQVEEDPKANTAVKRVAVKDRAANDEPRKFPPEKKLNINKASAQMIADTIRGIGIRTAREIKDAQMSLPGEKFSDIEQLRKIPKVDWDLVFKDELIRL
jgi:DNA uptake protein ComE-like DNA-binding protein